MKKRKLKNAGANEGIQANKVTADVIAVGARARATKRVESSRNGRNVEPNADTGRPLAGKANSILFLSADPTNVSRLRLGEEMREIREKIQLGKFRGQISLAERTSVRPEDFTQALLDARPTIVHFSGHGTSEGSLCFEDRSGQVKPIDASALAALFAQFSNQVICVMLNACYSAIQATAIARHIKYVIGMRKEIGDAAAISFAIGFYQGIGAGLPINEAYELGCLQIRLQGIPEHLTPILHDRTGA